MAREFQSYHWAWLSAHPERSAEWLRSRLQDGFDVHHIDGNHANDDAANLVLIEASDHMMLHGGRLSRVANYGKRGPQKETLRLGQYAYEERNLRGCSWRAIGGRAAMSAAKRYAQHTGKAWPPAPTVG